ncbi:MAG: FHA domain-containing protein [Gammaproteobacteria bacterium]|nr:FHA domain-containing protein [Gammaproteobacteria bacterium]
MALLAAHFNDAGLSLLDEQRILYREPGFALLDDSRLFTGAAAFAQARLHPRHVQNRFWSQLTSDALEDRRFQHLSAADLVSRQLEDIWQNSAADADYLVVAVPPYMQTEHLSLLLGIAAGLNIPIAAMVDSAVAATRREYRNAVPVHVDMSLHSALLTRITQTGQAQLERSVVVEGSGLMQIFDEWIKVAAEAFVQQSRFDPLHTAETEQALQNGLVEWALGDRSAGNCSLQIDYRGSEHRADVESLQLIAAAAPVYQRIVSQLRALYRAEETPAIQMTDRAARLPGLADMLAARVGGDVFLLEPGATARGLMARCRDKRPGDGAVSLIRQLPWDQSPVTLQAMPRQSGGHPTHLLFENTAYALNGTPLTLGTQAAQGERSIEFNNDMPGISRRHCSLLQENGQCVVRDFSRHGTFLNGHAIDGSAVLQVGDLLRVGTPGFELRLITTEAPNGS